MLRKKILPAVLVMSIIASSAYYVGAADSSRPEQTNMQQDRQRPEMPNGEAPDGQPPEKPSGEAPNGQPPEMPSGEAPNGQPPEMPSGEAPNGQPPEMPSGEAPDTAKKLSFKDVDNDAWYYEPIAKAYNGGLVSGFSDDEFQPDGTITGAQLITILYRADGNTLVQGSGAWYDSAVEWAKSKNILTADNGWDFQPNAALTREQMMVIIYRYMQNHGMSAASGDLSAFGDADKVSDYAKEAVTTLVKNGIISGDGNNLEPQSSLTRAQTAVIAVKALLGNSSDKADGRPDGEGSGRPGGFGGSSTAVEGSAANTITQDGTYTNESYTSTGDDENALLIDGASVTLENISADKSAGATSNTENGDFYGINAAVLAKNGAQVTIKNSDISSSAQNGNGVFSYGSGTVVNIYNSAITTTADNSGGIQTTGGGTTNAYSLTVKTSGNSSAAIRSDRGGGTVNVDGGSYTSNGYNSPAVYSTADITVTDADLTANNSEALVIEGKNSISLTDCDVYGNMSSTKGSSSDENVHNIMIYQSMSGDAAVGTSSLSIDGGSVTGNNGDMIYVTNTHAVISLKNADITNNDTSAAFLRVCGNSASHGWGNAGSNGAQAEVTADSQNIDGDIVVDSISTLELTLKNGSVLNGTVNIEENTAGTAVDNNAVITVGTGCTWSLTGDCTVTSLTNNGTINYNGHTITLADGTILG